MTPGELLGAVQQVSQRVGESVGLPGEGSEGVFAKAGAVKSDEVHATPVVAPDHLVAAVEGLVGAEEVVAAQIDTVATHHDEAFVPEGEGPCAGRR